jgi:hypothetical protein
MWKSFVSELRGEWSEPADECGWIGICQTHSIYGGPAPSACSVVPSMDSGTVK